MKTIDVRIGESNIPLLPQEIATALRDYFGANFPVRELPSEPEQKYNGRSCENCGNNRGKPGMPCLLCGGAIDPPDFSHWQPKPGKMSDAEIYGECEHNAERITRLKAEAVELRGALEQILRICCGDEGPKLSCEFETDARYQYPEKIKLINDCAKRALGLRGGE